jgi:CheY-like chemotaxis protein
MSLSVLDRRETDAGVSPCSVLLVDDDLALLEAFPETLRLRLPEVHVEVCESGQEALERIETTDYDAIISDLTLPGMEGVTFLDEVKQRLPASPVLFMTGQMDGRLVARALQAGAYDFIQKPIDRDQVVLSVKRALEAHELRTFCRRQDALVSRLYQDMRQLHQILRPLLLCSLKAIGRELGDERIEQSRTLMETVVGLCSAQCRLVRHRTAFIERYLDDMRQRRKNPE